MNNNLVLIVSDEDLYVLDKVYWGYNTSEKISVQTGSDKSICEEVLSNLVKNRLLKRGYGENNVPYYTLTDFTKSLLKFFKQI